MLLHVKYLDTHYMYCCGREHLVWLTQHNPHKRHKWIHDEYHRTFKHWFREKVSHDVKNLKNVPENLLWISKGPSHIIVKHDRYKINGFRFNTKALDEKRVTQNSGVSIVAKTPQVASVKDNNLIYAYMTFYGVIKEIWELNYHSFKIPIFKCDWVEIVESN